MALWRFEPVSLPSFPVGHTHQEGFSSPALLAAALFSGFNLSGM